MLGHKWDFENKEKSGWTGMSYFVASQHNLFHTRKPDPEKGLISYSKVIEKLWSVWQNYYLCWPVLTLNAGDKGARIFNILLCRIDRF